MAHVDEPTEAPQPAAAVTLGGRGHLVNNHAKGRSVWFLKKEPVDKGVGPVNSCCKYVHHRHQPMTDIRFARRAACCCATQPRNRAACCCTTQPRHQAAGIGFSLSGALPCLSRHPSQLILLPLMISIDAVVVSVASLPCRAETYRTVNPALPASFAPTLLPTLPSHHSITPVTVSSDFRRWTS